jgi:prepilin-type N-terminal cleavage/methylation domain-containing protein
MLVFTTKRHAATPSSVRQSYSSGFTIIEVLVVTVVIATLASIVTFGYSRSQIDARDSARSAQATLVASALEKYYDTKGEYPSPRSLVNDYPANTGSTVATLLSLSDASILVMPKAPAGTTNSIASALGSTDVMAYVADSTVGNNNCQTNTTSGCEEFTLSYKKEADGSIVTIKSTNHARPDDGSSPLEAPSKPTLTASQSGTSIIVTSSAVSGCSSDANMTPRYSFRVQVGAGSWSEWSTWQTGTTYTQTSNTNGVTYNFQAQTRCESTANYSDISTPSDVVSVTYYVTPSTPSVPTLSLSPAAGTVATSATATTSGSTCDYGTLQYAIDYRTNDGSWTTGTWGTGTTQTVNANQGTKYGFRATARCVNGTQTATGSTSSESTVITGISTPGGNPTVSGGGQSNPNWSWSPASCPSGTSLHYFYQLASSFGTGSMIDAGTATSASNPAATSQGVDYNILVSQRCDSAYTYSGITQAWGPNTYIPVVHVQIQKVGFRLSTNTSGAWPVIRINTFTGVCAAGTLRQAMLYGNYDMATNNWQADVNTYSTYFSTQNGNWMDASGTPEITFWNATVASGNYFELTGRARCINTSTGHDTDSAGNRANVGFVYDPGNLYNQGSNYNIACTPGSIASWCAGGYNSSGTSTDTTLQACAVRASGISTSTKAYTKRWSYGTNSPCYAAT